MIAVGRSAVWGERAAADQDRFGRTLRRLRERAGLTQVQLATRLGYNHSYLSKIESGDRVPGIAFASHADDELAASGVLLALAASERAQRHAGGSDTVANGSVVAPLPCAPLTGTGSHPAPAGRIQLPSLGVTCPLHTNQECAVTVDMIGGIKTTGTVGAETLHGFAALLTVYIDSDLRAVASETTASVERTLRALMDLVPRARGRIAVGLLQLAARYADLAGWQRVERGQHGIGMMWLQRAVEWASASGNLATASESLTTMSVLSWLEGDGATALEHSRAAAAVDGRRRWAVVQANLHEARSHALLGDGREFDRHAGDAQRAAERLSDRDRVEAPWLFDAEGAAFVAAHLAGGLRDLAETTGDRAIAGRAVAYAETSLANLPAWMASSRLMLTLRLADSLACRGDLNAAVAVARPVVAAATAAGTTLIGWELDRLRTRLGDRFSESFDSS